MKKFQISALLNHALVVVALIALMPLARADGLTLEQIAKLRQVTSVQLSPDGDQLAYTLSVPRDLSREDDGSAWSELHVIGPDGQSRPYISGQVSVGGLAWRPDSSALVFLDKRGDDDTRRLYALPVDGGEARSIAALETDISGYSFSPDGRQAALLAFEKEDSDLESERDKGFNQVVYEEGLSHRRIWIVDLENTDAEPRMLALDGSVQEV
ncbi:MAG: hypothetical protein ACPGJE_09000, partial [Wenzhouxiangellaceae bacterium]